MQFKKGGGIVFIGFIFTIISLFDVFDSGQPLSRTSEVKVTEPTLDNSQLVFQQNLFTIFL